MQRSGSISTSVAMTTDQAAFASHALGKDKAAMPRTLPQSCLLVRALGHQPFCAGRSACVLDKCGPHIGPCKHRPLMSFRVDTFAYQLRRIAPQESRRSGKGLRRQAAPYMLWALPGRANSLPMPHLATWASTSVHPHHEPCGCGGMACKRCFIVRFGTTGASRFGDAHTALFFCSPHTTWKYAFGNTLSNMLYCGYRPRKIHVYQNHYL